MIPILNEQALQRLRLLAQADKEPKPLERSADRIEDLPVGRTYRENVIAGDGSGTQVVVDADYRRIAFVLSALGSTVTIRLSSPVIQDTGIILANQQAPFLFHKKDYGPLVRMQWFAFITNAINLYVIEILE